MATTFVTPQVISYQILANRLREEYGEIDDDTLADTLDGITGLPELLRGVIRSTLEDEMISDALKARTDEMESRLHRVKQRAEKKRKLVCWAMGQAGLQRLEAEDFSVSMRPGASRVEIRDLGALPPEFLTPLPPRPDKARLLSRLKQGTNVPGAALVEGEAYISVSVK